MHTTNSPPNIQFTVLKSVQEMEALNQQQQQIPKGDTLVTIFRNTLHH